MADRLILVTGGTGPLGRPLVRSLLEGGARVRVLTRQLPGRRVEGAECAVADYVAATGLAQALAGVSGVVHAAHDLSDPLRDVRGTLNLLEAARAAGRPHFAYVSIVGARRVRGFGYYAGKVRGEELVKASGLPHLIFRATQFHHFADELLTQASRLPRLLVPDGVLQSAAVEDVARELARRVLAGERGTLDFAGPEVLRIPDMARAWLAARGRAGRVLPLRLPLPHPVLRAMQRGDLVEPEAPRGTVTWADYLSKKAEGG
ncbi:SDR family oxidoreductase [Deinococcus planocerae]|uniref:SDR family oxidoreductase n=1 Tax=Deinococcus planocerae TaxID=1737569 RepID=UPI000C7F7183|nr:NAD(P)H-binding protein [Deinococcus planocerae]